MFNMSLVDEVFTYANHTSYLLENCVDHWKGTQFEGYSLLNNKQKGVYGENVTSDIMRVMGYNVQDRLNSGHDIRIQGIKTEVKFSLAQTDQKNKVIKPDVFTLNHAAIHKDWDRLIFIGINPDDNHRMFWFTKKDFASVLVHTFFSRQQGGKKGDNDDYICSANNLVRLRESSYVRKLNEW